MKTLFDDTKEISGAAFSICRNYRYALWRIWNDNEPLIMFIGLNPSTANEKTNDPTIRRVISFARSLGYGGVYMMNCFPLVSTNPVRLREFYNSRLHDANDFTNARWLINVSRKCKNVVFAWGDFKEARQKAKSLSRYFKNAKALQLNKNGSPKHPLYVPGNVIPVNFIDAENKPYAKHEFYANHQAV